MRRLFEELGLDGRCLTEHELAVSLAATLASRPGDGDVWVFGYGSLVWNPLLDFVEARPATVHGYHRQFCHWSMTTRGTVDCPGLVLALDRGGQCRGVAYRIPAPRVDRELALLWRREMVVGSYLPTWAAATIHRPAGEGRHRARVLAFVMNRAHVQYAGRLALERVARSLALARGSVGSARDYLEHTVAGLARHGVRDRMLDRLVRMVAVANPARGNE